MISFKFGLVNFGFSEHAIIRTFASTLASVPAFVLSVFHGSSKPVFIVPGTEFVQPIIASMLLVVLII